MKIETRDHLLSTLAEASELEHNLLCLYLYAVASLKQSTAEGVTEAGTVHWERGSGKRFACGSNMHRRY